MRTGGHVVRLTDCTWGAYVNDRIVGVVVVRDGREVVRVPVSGAVQCLAVNLTEGAARVAAEAEARRLAGLS